MTRVGAALCAVLSLSACNEAGGVRANSKICIDFNQGKGAPPLATSDSTAAVDDCARRWAYSLAPSHDDAETVADAVVAACSAPLSRWNQQSLNQPAANGGEATSIITGQPTTPLAEHFNFARNRAMLYVVQARAGNCSPPPAKNGVPEGVS